MQFHAARAATEAELGSLIDAAFSACSGMNDDLRVNRIAARTMAGLLLGGTVDEALNVRSCGAFLDDPNGLIRLDAMCSAARELHPDHADTWALRAHHALLDVLGVRHGMSERRYEQVADWLALITAASGFDDACQRAAQAVHELVGFSGVAVYVTGPEHARLVRAASVGTDGHPGSEPPAELRIDRGIFADAMAGERPLFMSGAEPTSEMPASLADARTLMAVPMRDQVGRPVGLVIAWSVDQHSLDAGVIEAVRRTSEVLAGVLVSARIAEQKAASVAVLPELARVALGAPVDAASQLEDLCGIIMRATSSDAAVIRLIDPAGRFLDTPAVAVAHRQAAGDVIGARSEASAAAAAELGSGGEVEFVGMDPDTPATSLVGWSPEGLRIITELGGRTLAAYPVGSRHERPAVLYVVRNSARPFDDVDRSCMRIVTSHAQHVIDRHVSSLQVRRAIGAARNAIRLLGEALVAGVHAERTTRFVPRLYAEMFGTTWCRSWRVDRSEDIDAVPGLVASVGTSTRPQPAQIVLDAATEPLTLHLDTTERPHVAAIGMEAFRGETIVIEFQLPRERSLGQEEQHLAVDVAIRISEALRSAGQAAAHEHQLIRMQSLQDVASEAHSQLSEAHVLATVMDQVPAQYGARAAAVFLAEGGGRIRAASNHGLPDNVIAAVEASRSWVTDIARDNEASDRLFSATRIGSDQRLAAFHEVARAAEVDTWGILIVPLMGREQTMGMLVMLFEDGVPAQIGDDHPTLREFGRQIGSALVNAREFERERVARLRTQRMLDDERENSRQVRALHEVSRTFAASLSLDETMRAVVEAMAHRLDVDAVWIRTPNDRGDMLELRAFYASHPELSEALERMVSAPAARTDAVMARVVQSRQPVLFRGDDPDPDIADSPALGRLQAFLQHGSTVAVLPVAIPNEVLGTLTMLSIDPDHALTWDKVEVAAGVTGQAALALDNARLYQQQKNFAEVIQESLLPGRLPDIEGIELGVLYRSATAGGVEAPLIGGDFYDFLELEDGRLALAVGDVTGKGVGAAADTAMTKYIFRALAREHPSPSSFLRYANDVVCEEITPGKFVTLFYAVIDPRNGTILCGNAGHPEPKIVHVDGSNEATIESVGMEGLALGILPDQDYEERSYRFGPGATLVAYTDGVVEARREGKLYGQYRLERRLIDEAGASAPHVAFSIYQDCAAYADDGLGDDVAIVVAQRVEEL